MTTTKTKTKPLQKLECVVIIPAGLEKEAKAAILGGGDEAKVTKQSSYSSAKTSGLKVTLTKLGADRYDVSRRLQSSSLRGRFFLMDIKTTPVESKD